MANNKSAKNKLTKIQPWLFLLCGILLLAMTFAGFYAKYVYQTSEKKSPIAERFYFTSDYLSKDGKTYNLTSNTTQLTFELRNYQDELESADSDIEYSYTVKKNNAEIKNATGTIKKQANGKNSITIDGLSAGKYVVTAAAQSPFKETLTGTFIIPEESKSLDYKVSDSKQSAYILLEISTDAYEGKIKIQWPDGLIPDSTQKIFEGVQNLNNGKYTKGNITVQVGKYSANTYRFFKEDTDKEYSEKDITVEKVTN